MYGVTPEAAAPPAVRWTSLLIWLGAGVMLAALSAHTSQRPDVLGRYSLPYVLLLAALLIGLAASGTLLLLRWRQWPLFVAAALGRLPALVPPAAMVSSGAGLLWLLVFGASRYGFLASPLLRLGLLIVWLGSSLLLFAAAGTHAQPAARAATQLHLMRGAIAAVLFAGLTSLALRGVADIAAGRVLLSTGLAALSLTVAFGLGTHAGPLAPWVDRTRAWLARNAFARALAAAGIVAAYVGVIYSPGRQHALINMDELTLLAQTYGRAPWIGFLEPLPQYAALYRPLFLLQAWSLYQLFGVDYGAYYAVQLVVLVATCVSAGLLFWKLSRSALAGLLAALLLAGHVFISDQITGWVIDVMPYTGLMAVAVAMMLRRWRGGWPSYVALFALLLAAALSRENGLAVTAATGLYALYAGITRLQPRRQAAIISLVCVAAITAYLALRAVNAAGAQFSVGAVEQETGFFNRLYSEAEMAALAPAQRLAVYGYTVAANLVGNFIMLFGPVGTLHNGAWAVWAGVAAMAAALVAALTLDVRLAQRWAAASTGARQRALLMLALCLALVTLAAYALAARVWPARPIGLAQWQFALHSVLSVCIAIAALRARHWPPAHRALALFGLGLIAASSLAAFPYFRYRSQYLSYLGWAIVFVIALANLGETGWRRALRTALAGLAALLIIVNGARVYAALPLPHLLAANFTYRGWLCAPEFPAALAEAIAARYDLDPGRLNDCRTQPQAPTEGAAASSTWLSPTAPDWLPAGGW